MLLEAHAVLTRQEKGCLVFNVIKNSKNPNCLKVKEEFTNRELFEGHQSLGVLFVLGCRVGKRKMSLSSE